MRTAEPIDRFTIELLGGGAVAQQRSRARFDAERELGAGGMGSVYLARHPRLPRFDALKLLRSELCADPGFVGRFEREADTVAQLDHPNIVPVYDRGSQDGQLWISMRFIVVLMAIQKL